MRDLELDGFERIARKGNRECVSAALDAFDESDETASQRATRAYALGLSGSAESWDELLSFSFDRSPLTRRMVAGALEKLAPVLGGCHSGALEVLRRLIFKEKHSQVRQYALKALRRYDWNKEEIRPLLKSIVADSTQKSYLREAAAALLGVKIPGSTYRKALDALAVVEVSQAINVARDILNWYGRGRQDEIYDSLDRGKAVLTSEEQCAGYMAWFAKKHLAKFRKAFDYIPSEACENVLDVFDWGSGIGLSAFAFRDWYERHFPERRYCKKIRRFTLIEPSTVALEWASYNAKRCFPEAIVRSVQKMFSNLKAADFGKEENNPTQCRLHIFSNVLDISDIRGREAMKGLVEKFRRYALGWDDIVILISPNYGNVGQTFDCFWDALSEGRTERFEKILDTQNFSWSKEDGDETDACGVIAVWRVRSEAKCSAMDSLSPKWRSVYDQLLMDDSAEMRHRRLVDFLHRRLCMFPDEEIDLKYRPNVYGNKPDMIVRRKYCQPLIVMAGRPQIKNNAEPVCPDKNYMKPVLTIKSELFKNNRELFRSQNAYGSVSVAVYNPDADSLCVYKGKDNGGNALYEWSSALKWKYIKSDDEALGGNAINAVLAIRQCSGSVPVVDWDAKQMKLIVSRCGMQKITGSFGSGKTTVLVERAISAYQRTHKTVVILTYNISLRNHIEHAIFSRMDANLSGKEFLVLNIHQFIRIYGLDAVGWQENVMDFLADGKSALAKFISVARKLTKFKTILVDECQDFEYEWLEILRQTFLAYGGEYVLFGDVKQNVYGRALDGKKIRTNIPGEWNVLNTCHRSHGALLNYLVRFQSAMPMYDRDVVEDFLLLDDSRAEYFNLTGTSPEVCVEIIIGKVHELGGSWGKCAVLAESHDFLRGIEKAYRVKSHHETEVMFWRSEEMDNAQLRKYKDERDFKLFFDGDQTEKMKFSTIESFKGFEAETVFLFIEASAFRNDKRLLEVVYTGMTRAQKNLFVYNLGNVKMAEVFASLK